jgi:hypothetical protein
LELTALTAAATATGTSAAFRSAVFASARFVDSQGASLKILAREGLDGRFRAFRRGHCDKTEAARTAAHAIGNKVNLGNRAMLLEKILQIILGGVEGKISHVQFRIHFSLLVLESLAGFRELFPLFGFQIITERSSPEDPPCWKLAMQSKLGLKWTRSINNASFIFSGKVFRI